MSRFRALRADVTDEELATGEKEAQALQAARDDDDDDDDGADAADSGEDTPPERARLRLAALQLRHEAEEARPRHARREGGEAPPPPGRDVGDAAATPAPATPRREPPRRAREVAVAAPRAARGVAAGEAEADAATAALLSQLPQRVAPSGLPLQFELSRDWAPGMRVPARFFANEPLLRLLAAEAAEAAPASHAGGAGGFASALQQLANVATLPGIVGASLGMPDIHAGYGFAIGNVAAFDLDDPEAVVSPGGVGFDINCGVRLLRTSLRADALEPPGVLRRLADALYRAVPVGTGADARATQLSAAELEEALRDGMAFLERRGWCTADDRDATEERGAFAGADPRRVSDRAKARATGQAGTLGAGNHYLEVQVVEAVYDPEAAASMGLQLGGVAVMLHTGSRGLGHQVCTDYLQRMDAAKDGIRVVDRQLACVRVSSAAGRDYLAAMRAAANFAFVNRTLLANDVRRAFAQVFEGGASLGMRQVYDVAHNVAKEEEHALPGDAPGRTRRLLVHRKGATRAFPPGHPSLPARYAAIGQPVLVGGSMSTASYVLVGTAGAMERSFGSTCHGAGRALSRAKALRTLDSHDVLRGCEQAGVEVRIQTRRLAAEEAAAAYKDVAQVVQTCHDAGISRLVAKLRPVVSVKG